MTITKISINLKPIHCSVKLHVIQSVTKSLQFTPKLSRVKYENFADLFSKAQNYVVLYKLDYFLYTFSVYLGHQRYK